MDPVHTDPAQPLWFAARFPRQSGFAPAVSELTIRIAHLCGYEEGAARAIGLSVDDAMRRDLEESVGADGSVEVAFQADNRGFEVTVSSRGRPILTLTRPRPS
jgi:hypothetical protein